MVKESSSNVKSHRSMSCCGREDPKNVGRAGSTAAVTSICLCQLVEVDSFNPSVAAVLRKTKPSSCECIRRKHCPSVPVFESDDRHHVVHWMKDR